MSSMRNAIQRRVHRERAQPVERQRLGLLEKHKDYALRAKDYNKKKAQLKTLRQKAAERNDDEFYFGMLSRKGPSSKLMRGKKWSGTVDADRGNAILDMDTSRLLKTQDMGYLRTVRNLAAKEVAGLEQSAAVAQGMVPADYRDADEEDGDGVEGEGEDEDEDDEDAAPPRRRKASKPRKIVFAEGEDDRDLAMGEGDDAEDDGEVVGGGDDTAETDRKRKSTKEETDAQRNAHRAAKLRRKLVDAKRKLKALETAEQKLDLQLAHMAKTKTVGDTTKSGRQRRVRERKR